MLLFGCCLPRSAWPCEHAANGVIGVDGGVGHLRERLRSQDFWQGLQGPDSDAAVREVVTDLEAFLSSMIKLVRQTCVAAGRPQRTPGVCSHSV